MPDPKMVNIVHPDAPQKTFSIPESDVADAIEQGFQLEGSEGAIARVERGVNERMYGGTGGKVIAAGLGVARGATLGLSDAALRAAGAEDIDTIRDINPLTSLAGEIGGAIATGGTNLPAGLATKLGARVAKTAEGAGAISQIGGAAKGAAVEGALFGAGQGVSELALSDDPLTVERMASVIGSNALFGGLTGGAIGGVGKGVGLGLRKAKDKLDEIATRGLDTSVDAGADLATLDRKGLRAAEKLELEAIEAARVPRRAELADEIKAFRQELRANKPWLATKDAEDGAIRAIGARTRKADRALDSILDDPKALAESPRQALKQLRVQEAALDDLVTKHADDLRAKFAGDTSGDRLKALDYASVALEKNRALQAKIAEVSAKPASARLEAIADRLAQGPAAKGAGAMDALGDAAMGYGLGMVAGVPGLGMLVGAARVAAPILKKLGVESTAAAQRGSKAIAALMDVGAKIERPARVLATKTLSSVAYGELQADRKKSREPKPSRQSLADHYKARSAEIRALTEPGVDMKPVMRMSERQKMNARLRPIAAVHPLLADKIETTKARAVEFLASVLPRKPDLPGMTGDWQPSDMEMRQWARYVAAVEDPHGVVERLASGSVTPEDAEAMKQVYPEMYADIQAQIVSQLGTLAKKLPYHRRLALSIFSGVAVDPALDPRVLSVLQASFAREDGTEEGTQAPVAQAQFGSVTREEPTPGQMRGVG